MQRLTETGRKEQLLKLLRERLISSGWRDNVKAHCKELIQNKGLEQLTVEDLVNEVTPFARGTVPEELSVEVRERVRQLVESNDDDAPVE